MYFILFFMFWLDFSYIFFFFSKVFINFAAQCVGERDYSVSIDLQSNGLFNLKRKIRNRQ